MQSAYGKGLRFFILSQLPFVSESGSIAQKRNLKMEMRRDVAFQRSWIYVAVRQGMSIGFSSSGGRRHETGDRASVVRSGWNWFDAHDAGGAGAFRGQGTAISPIEIGTIERSAAPVCG
jgi:hypothetical protein